MRVRMVDAYRHDGNVGEACHEEAAPTPEALEQARACVLRGNRVPPCEVPDADLVAYAEGDLRGARGEWVAAHLAACPSCQERLALFAAVDTLLRADPVPDLDPAQAAWMRAYLDAHPQRHRFPPPWPWRYRPRWPHALSVALVAKVGLLALLFWPGSGLTLVQVRVPLALATLAVLVALTPPRARRTD